jgi:pantothenate kinase type III
MIWAVLIGNTRTVSALMGGTRVRKKKVVPTERLKRASGIAAWVKSLGRPSNIQGTREYEGPLKGNSAGAPFS